MSKKLGKDCKAYRNTGPQEAPVWVEIDTIVDLTWDDDSDEVDFSNRASGGINQVDVTFYNWSFAFGIIVDNDDPHYAAFLAARKDRTEIDMLVLNGDKDTDGSEGARLSAVVTKFARAEPLKDKAMRDIVVKPGQGFAPSYYVVDA